MSDQEHYFTAEPASAQIRREITVDLAGRLLTVETAPGIFCPDRLDLGTSVLLREVPPAPQEGHLLDLGCGWGPLCLTMALDSPGAVVWGVDVNRRALDLVRRNAARHGAANLRAVEPDDVPDDVTFAAIWSNPPIRVGKAVLHDMMLRWLPRLAPGGTAHLVVQKNLGADSLHAWLAGTLGPRFASRRLASAKGFRILEVHHHALPPEETA